MNLKKMLCMALAMLLTLGAAALAEPAEAEPAAEEPAVVEEAAVEEPEAELVQTPVDAEVETVEVELTEPTNEELQAQLEAALERIEALKAEVALYKPFYEQQIVVEYGNGGVVWLADAQAEYEAAASAYSQYGLSIDDYADAIKQSILEKLTEDAVLADKAAELGLDQMSDEERANLEAEAAENFETYIETYKGYFAADVEDEEAAREQTIATLEQYGLTLETLTQQMLDSYVSEQLHSYITKDVAVTDADIQAAYEQMVSDDETNFADDYTYNTTRDSAGTIAWNPEGYRAVKHVLIKFDDEQATLYSNLNSTLQSLNAEMEALENPAEETEAADAEGEEAEAPRTREEIQADIGSIAAQIEALYSQLLPQAQQVIDEFEGGADFDELIEKYNADPGMTREPTASNGYAVSADSTTWDPAFTEGAMGIASVGEISGPVYGMNGIHVIYYMSDITPGPVPFEEVAEAAEELALTTKIDETYEAQVAAWVEEAAPVYHPERF